MNTCPLRVAANSDAELVVGLLVLVAMMGATVYSGAYFARGARRRHLVLGRDGTAFEGRKAVITGVVVVVWAAFCFLLAVWVGVCTLLGTP